MDSLGNNLTVLLCCLFQISITNLFVSSLSDHPTTRFLTHQISPHSQISAINFMYNVYIYYQ